ncbi:MAG: hypothetical protein OCD01_10265 [Fibrobacterales bacterium]
MKLFGEESDWAGFGQSSIEKYTGGGFVMPTQKKSAPEDELIDEATEQEVEEEEEVVEEEPQIVLSNLQFVRPETGYEIGERAAVSVDIEVIGDSPEPYVSFALYAHYRDSSDLFLSCTGAHIASGVAKTSIHLAYPDEYLADLQSNSEDQVAYYCIASHEQCTEDVTSTELIVPDELPAKDSQSQAQVLKEAAEAGTPFCEECEKIRAENEKKKQQKAEQG